MARILLALCVIFSSPAYATIGEDIFKQAPVYTVQIRTLWIFLEGAGCCTS